MSKVYFVSTEDLLINVLALKAEVEKKRVAKTITNLAEITKICDYASKKTNNGIVFENSYRNILATTQLYPYKFFLNSKTGEISLSPKCSTKNRKKLKEIYALVPEIINCFRSFFKEKMDQSAKRP